MGVIALSIQPVAVWGNPMRMWSVVVVQFFGDAFYVAGNTNDSQSSRAS